MHMMCLNANLLSTTTEVVVEKENLLSRDTIEQWILSQRKRGGLKLLYDLVTLFNHYYYTARFVLTSKMADNWDNFLDDYHERKTQVKNQNMEESTFIAWKKPVEDHIGMSLETIMDILLQGYAIFGGRELVFVKSQQCFLEKMKSSYLVDGNNEEVHLDDSQQQVAAFLVERLSSDQISLELICDDNPIYDDFY